MSLSKVTFSLCTLANATTLVSAPTITTATILLTIDFITALLAFWVDSVLLIALSATKHHSQLPYDKNFYSINAASQESLTCSYFRSRRIELPAITRLGTPPQLERFPLYLLFTNLCIPLQFSGGCFGRLTRIPCTKLQISEGDLE